MSPAASQSPSDLSLDRGTWIVAGVVIVGVVMSILDTTIVNVALDSLSRDLGAPLSTIQWVSTGYLLALAMVIPLAGWMSERFGSKRIWLVSVTLFGLGSALCGLAASADMLIFFRVLQGLGGGMIMPVAMSVLAQTAGPRRIGRVMSVVGVPTLLGPILGAISAAYARLDSAQVPRATSAINALQRVGGSIGTALLAVVLQSETRSAMGGGTGSAGLQPVSTALRERVADPLASAFGHTFLWATGLCLLAVIAAALLARSERSGQDAKQRQPREPAHARAAAAS